MVDERREALPGTWETLTCVIEVLRPNGKWCAIPSEIIPSDIRGVLESQAVLNMDESMNKEFAKKLRNEHGLLQVMRMNQRPGNQCLSWIKGDLIMLPTIVFPKTYGVKNFPMMARYPLERWRKSDYLHLTENDWRNFTSPISSQRRKLMSGCVPLPAKSMICQGTGGGIPGVIGSRTSLRVQGPGEVIVSRPHRP